MSYFAETVFQVLTTNNFFLQNNKLSMQNDSIENLIINLKQ